MKSVCGPCLFASRQNGLRETFLFCVYTSTRMLQQLNNNNNDTISSPPPPPTTTTNNNYNKKKNQRVLERPSSNEPLVSSFQTKVKDNRHQNKQY